MRVPVAPHPCQYLVLSVFLFLANQISVQWFLTVGLVCIFLMTVDVEHLCMCFLAIEVCFFVLRLFKSFFFFKVIFTPTMQLELTTPRSGAGPSTDQASQMPQNLLFFF